MDRKFKRLEILKIGILSVRTANRKYMKKNKLTAKEVEDKFNSEEDLTDFFTEEVDPVTYEKKRKFDKGEEDIIDYFEIRENDGEDLPEFFTEEK